MHDKCVRVDLIRDPLGFAALCVLADQAEVCRECEQVRQEQQDQEESCDGHGKCYTAACSNVDQVA